MSEPITRVLVTGVSGFIGKALAARFAERSHLVFGIGSCDGAGESFTDFRALRLPDPSLGELVKTWRPDLVFHCAGSADPANSRRNPKGDFDASVPVVFEMLEALRNHSREARFVFLSSAAVYGQPASLPVAESARLAPLSPYGYHKILCETLCREYAELYGMRTTAARIFSAYGPGLKRQIVWDAIAKLHRGGEVAFFGTGGESRDFLHIDDLVDALFRIAGAEVDGFREWNVGSGVETTIADLVAEVASAMGVAPGSWTFAGVKDAGVPQQWRADIGELAKLGFIPSISLQSGLERTVAWALGKLNG